MNWEEYQNTDAYKESHPNWNYRPSKAQLKEEEMRKCIADIDEHEKFVAEHFSDDEENPKIVTYVTTKIRNGRVCGMLGTGAYKECRMRAYEYNLACIGSEYDWAGVERVEAENLDELEDILDGYRELICESICDYDDYEY